MAPGGFFSIIYSLEQFLAKDIKKDIFFIIIKCRQFLKT